MGRWERFGLGCRALATGTVLATGVVVSMASAAGASSTAPGAPDQCPARGPASVQKNSWSATSDKLAPAGATAIRLCRYDGLNSKPRLKFVGANLITSRKQVDKLIGQFDALKQLHGATSCPSDDASQILALISYGHRHQVRISIGLTGCSRVTNGNLTRTAANLSGQNPQGPKLLAELRRLA
jgi:hypothetical protein